MLIVSAASSLVLANQDGFFGTISIPDWIVNFITTLVGAFSGVYLSSALDRRTKRQEDERAAQEYFLSVRQEIDQVRALLRSIKSEWRSDEQKYLSPLGWVLVFEAFESQISLDIIHALSSHPYSITKPAGRASRLAFQWLVVLRTRIRLKMQRAQWESGPEISGKEIYAQIDQFVEIALTNLDTAIQYLDDPSKWETIAYYGDTHRRQ